MDLSNDSDRIMLSTKYEKIGAVKGNMAIVRQNKRYGIIDVTGSEVVECIYKHLYLAPKSYYYEMAKGLKNNPYLYIGVVDGRKIFLLPSVDTIFDSTNVDMVNVLSDREIMLIKDALCSIYDLKEGRILFSGFEAIAPFGSGLYKVKKDNKWGICNRKGEIIVPLTYEDLHYHGDSLFSACKDNLNGFINSKNEIVVPLQYTNIYQYNPCLNDNKYFALYLTSPYCPDPQFQIYDVKKGTLSNLFSGTVEYAPFGIGGYFWLKSHESYKLVRPDGTIITTLPHSSWDEMNSLLDGLLFLEDGVSYFYRTKTCADMTWRYSKERIYDDLLLNIQSHHNFDAIYCFENAGVTRVVKNQKYGLISKEGDLLMTPQFDAIFKFRKGFAAVCLAEKWGMVNDEGKMIVPCLFDKQVLNYGNGRFLVHLNGKPGIFSTGNSNITCDYYLPALFLHKS